ncbi:uncharacterized protein LOC106013609 [Aplysia californica]|uniref:Uncharacterized protein LOC106013609 n=1 Tax=Aplysia californica TaxID=6500 RepID=A0ABM1ACV3_APLCA|nr:uncharacterized protein LOC106013609 [Aplysia californica]
MNLKQDTHKTTTFGKKYRSRRQQLRAARQSRASCKPRVSPQSEASPSSPLPGPSVPNPDSPQPVIIDPVTQTSTPTPSTQGIDHDVVCSASKRKLGYNNSGSPDQEVSTLLPSTIVELETLKPLFSGLLCPTCCSPSLSLESNEHRNSGLAISLVVKCESCGDQLSSTMTSSKSGSVFDVNRRAVAAACATGMGHAGLSNFSEIMNVPSLHHKTFAVHTTAISDKCSIFSRDILKKSVQKVKEAYQEQTSDVKDIHVSFDGSWQKRGHTSKSGIGLAIERKTGLIVDYEVLTSYCPQCATTGKRLERENILKYERWFSSHKPFCSANYEGPSGGMEKEAALSIWSRSILKHQLRYVSMISDGDAKTISELHALDPYPGTSVQKHECVNHVGKRLGKALQNIVTEKSKAKPKITLGGKGHGKLRPEVIKALQGYYTNAIRKHTSVPTMKQAVMAILDHCSSTDEDHHHENCPKGEDSWCFFQKAEARGLPPGSHVDNIGTPLCQLVADHVRPIFTRLSTDDLLGRCVLQSTQNANESAHAVIWARCPKHQFVHRNRLSIAVAIGVAEFNFGASSSRDFLTTLNLPVGRETKRRGEKRDHTRTVKSQVAATEKAKKYRQIKADARQREEQRMIDTYGEFYVSGGGD